MKESVGGGSKKILYTLKTIRQIGVANANKALRANNTCKACGLGMGGQQGGMTNEKGEFPSVCNKSVQAQKTDIQSAIPKELFKHSIEEMRSLSAKELEHTGRLNTPLYKAKDSNHFKPVDWQWALNYAVNRFKNTDAARSFFYSSGRSSNEAGFLLQLLARAYGTNNVTNCSYYCHQATSVGLNTTIGTGTSTVELDDLSQCDLVFIIGANPASNHPRLIHQLKNCRDRGGHVVVINPAREPGLVKFAVPKSTRSLLVGGTPIASLYIQPNIGGDVALLKGLAKAVLEKNAQDDDFINRHTTNFDNFRADVEQTSWSDIEENSGVSKEKILQLSNLYCQSKHSVFAWGMGITHHKFGCENVEYIANIALLRGMIAKRFSGLLPLRGHSNVQGIGTIGVKPVLAKEVFEKMEQHLGLKIPSEKGLDTIASLKLAYKNQMDCALIVGGNLYSATPNSGWANKALDRIGFKLFLTTTLNQGHIHGNDNSDVIILPVVARDEESQSTTQESMFNFVRLSDGGIKRLDNARSEIDILANFGAQLLPNHNIDFNLFTQHEHVRQSIAKIVPGMEAIQSIGVAKKEFHVKDRLIHTPTFNTNDKKAHFIVHSLSERNHAKENYPFTLASIRSEGQFNSIIYEEFDTYRFNATRQTLFMASEDMKDMSLNTGDKVTIHSKNGALENLKIQEFSLPPGNVLSYYPEVNVLSELHIDPRSKTPNFKSIPISIQVVQ